MKPASPYPQDARPGRPALPFAAAGCALLLSAGLQAGCSTAGPLTEATVVNPPVAIASARHTTATGPAGKAAAQPETSTAAAAASAPARHDQRQRQNLDAERTRQLFESAREHVADFTGVPLDAVRLELVSDQTIDRIVAGETRHLLNAQFDDSPFRQRLLDSIMQSQAGSYAALYVDSRATVMVSETLLHSYMESLLAARPRDLPADSLRDQALLALLVHELAHAADDSQHRIHASRTLTFRASFAQSAVFEGHAQWLTRQICAQQGCSEGLAALDRFMFAASQSTNRQTQSVQAMSRNVLEYSYVEGERFISSLAERANGPALVRQALENPPVDPIQILAPRRFPDRARDQRNNRLLAAAAVLDHPWQQSPWASVETSPLKGINLRAEPENRAAAIDGFTRLINAMVALQIYNQEHAERPPVEVTLIGTDNEATATTFARIMHENAQALSPYQRREDLTLKLAGSAPVSATVYAAYNPLAEAPPGQLAPDRSMNARPARTDTGPGRSTARPTGAVAQQPVVTPNRPAADHPADTHGADYASITAASGHHVVQLAGYASLDALRDYALQFLATIADMPATRRPAPVPAG